MSFGLVMALVVAFVMVVYAAVALRTLVRMRRARALVLAADMPEHPGVGQRAMTFAKAREWFAGKNCADCGRPIPALHHMGPQPGLKRRAPGSHPIMTWDEVPAGTVPLLSELYLPLCSNCQLAESLKQDYPDLMMERHGRHGAAPADARVPESR